MASSCASDAAPTEVWVALRSELKESLARAGVRVDVEKTVPMEEYCCCFVFLIQAADDLLYILRAGSPVEPGYTFVG